MDHGRLGQEKEVLKGPSPSTSLTLSGVSHCDPRGEPKDSESRPSQIWSQGDTHSRPRRDFSLRHPFHHTVSTPETCTLKRPRRSGDPDECDPDYEPQDLKVYVKGDLGKPPEGLGRVEGREGLTPQGRRGPSPSGDYGLLFKRQNISYTYV